MPRKPAPKKPRQRARGVVQRKNALQLRAEGHTYDQIAAKLKIAKSSAYELVERELSTVAAESKRFATTILDEELERCRFVLRSMAPKVAKGDPKAAQAFLRAEERIAKLLGIDAPTRAEVSGPHGTPIAHEIASTTPDALHARLAAAVARAARGADSEGARPDDGAGASGDPRGPGGP